MQRGMLIACAVFAAVSCASTAPPVAETALDWQLVAEEGMPVIVTGDTRWFQNIERDPDVVFRIGGYAYSLRAELVTDPQLEKRANAAFREKYGFQDRLIHPFGEPDKNVMRLVPRE